MTASESSLIGIAKQTAKGTPNTTDASFTYLLFTQGALGVQNQYLPLDMEVGGGAMLRNVLKVGVLAGGQVNFIPRPKSLGYFLYGVTGAVATTDNLDGSYTHLFKLGTDQFEAPWWTLRGSPGALTAEQYPDVRIASLALRFRAQRFMEGQVSFLGAGVPSKVSSATWDALPKVDGGPQFIAPIGTITIGGVSQAVVDGSFVAASQMPLDQQFKIGGYSPDNLSITQRSYMLNLAIKIDDTALYQKIMFDPAGGNNWVAEILRESNFLVSLKSDIEAATGVPYEFKIQANGNTGAGANVTWQCQPISMQAGRQLILAVSAQFLADPGGDEDPVKLTVINTTASY